MASQSLADQVKSDIQSMQSSLRELQSSVRLTEIRDSVEDLQLPKPILLRVSISPAKRSSTIIPMPSLLMVT